MRVLLLSANMERLKMPSLPLGLALVAAAVRRAGHDVRYLDLLLQPAPAAALRHALVDFAPEVVGLSVRNIDNQDMREPRFLLESLRPIVAECRSLSSARVCLGGAGFSIFPEATLAYLGADFGICGEGEAAFVELLNALAAGEPVNRVPNVCLPNRPAAPRTFAAELDTLPLAGDDLWNGADADDPDLWIPVQTRRGCPLGCSYCSTAAIEGRGVRARSPQAVAGHVGRLAEAGFARVYFVDNTFNLPTDYAMQLCEALQSLRKPVAWRCILYPHNVPESLVAAMARAGCVEASLGFESGSPSILRAMHKRFQPEQVRQISDRLAAHGIRRTGFLLLGGPGETRQTAQQSLDFADALKLEMLSLTVGVRIYPHTELAQTALAEGVVAADDDLLAPRFYVRPELDAWLREIAAAREKT